MCSQKYVILYNFIDERRPGKRVFSIDEFKIIMNKIDEEHKLAEKLFGELVDKKTKDKAWNYLLAFCESKDIDWLDGVSDLRKQFRDRRWRLRQRKLKATVTGAGSQEPLPPEYKRLDDILSRVVGISHGRAVGAVFDN